MAIAGHYKPGSIGVNSNGKIAPNGPSPQQYQQLFYNVHLASRRSAAKQILITKHG
jgi:hypothetical protein